MHAPPLLMSLPTGILLGVVVLVGLAALAALVRLLRSARATNEDGE